MTQPAPPLLEIDSVSYEAGGLRIIDAISWTVRAGEQWAVLGPNGSGKTTLLKLAGGYLWPNAGGEIRRLGEALCDLRELRRSIGWVSTSIGQKIPPREPVLDTVVSGRFAQTGLLPLDWDPPREVDYDQARRYLEELDCTALIPKTFGVLSQGEQQKVLIARARMALPLLVVLDEPCAGLDPAARENFLAAVQRIATKPDAPSFILVTHHLEEIMPAFTHLLVLRDGRVFRSGPTHELINEQLLADLYGAPAAQLIRHSGRAWPVW